MNHFEKLLSQKIAVLTGGKLKVFTPSLQIGVYQGGRKKALLKLGDRAKYFDLASLTKIIFGVSQCMHLENEGALSANDFVQKHWHWFPFKDVRIKDLLTHTAGFKDWSPYFEVLRDHDDPMEKWEKLLDLLLAEKRSKGAKALYSDIDFLFLGMTLEAITQKSLSAQWAELSKLMGVPEIHFSPGPKPKFSPSLYAPTEKCPWRKKHLRGEVHDDNTWSMGGVSVHAGLFGDIDSVMKFAKLIRKSYFQGSKLASKKVAQKYMRRAIPKTRGDFALGYMMPSKSGSTAGKYFSSKSVGHTGFTGTSIWFDPVRDLVVVILSNRVSPTRDNVKFRALRPQIHDAVVEILS